MKRKCIICDIDNVYVDSREWEKYLPKRKDDRKGWNTLLQHIGKCVPNDFIIRLINILAQNYPIFFITSREGTETLRRLTVEQIEEFSEGNILLRADSKHKLYMRECDDFREPYKVKEEILLRDVLPNYEPIMAFEDDENNVKMYRKYGIDTIHYKEFLK